MTKRKSDLTLDSQHIYRWRGRVVPGLHQVLEELGIIRGFGTEADLMRGQAVALATRYLDRGGLDWTSLDPRLLGYVRGWLAFKAASRVRILEVERSRFCRRLGFATTPDREVVLNGRWGVLELKTGASLPSWTGRQLAGEALACEEAWPRRGKPQRWAVLVKKDGRFSLEAFGAGGILEAAFIGAVSNYNLERRR